MASGASSAGSGERWWPARQLAVAMPHWRCPWCTCKLCWMRMCCPTRERRHRVRGVWIVWIWCSTIRRGRALCSPPLCCPGRTPAACHGPCSLPLCCYYPRWVSLCRCVYLLGLCLNTSWLCLRWYICWGHLYGCECPLYPVRSLRTASLGRPNWFGSEGSCCRVHWGKRNWPRRVPSPCGHRPEHRVGCVPASDAPRTKEEFGRQRAPNTHHTDHKNTTNEVD